MFSPEFDLRQVVNVIQYTEWRTKLDYTANETPCWDYVCSGVTRSWLWILIETRVWWFYLIS